MSRSPDHIFINGSCLRSEWPTLAHSWACSALAWELFSPCVIAGRSWPHISWSIFEFFADCDYTVLAAIVILLEVIIMSGRGRSFWHQVTHGLFCLLAARWGSCTTSCFCILKFITPPILIVLLLPTSWLVGLERAEVWIVARVGAGCIVLLHDNAPVVYIAVRALMLSWRRVPTQHQVNTLHFAHIIRRRWHTL